MCAGGSGLIPGADKLDSGFHPSGVGKMSSNKYVVGILRTGVGASPGKRYRP